MSEHPNQFDPENNHKMSIEKVTHSDIELMLEQTDENRDPILKSEYPRVPYALVIEEYRGQWVGILPTRVGVSFRFEEVRVVANALDPYRLMHHIHEFYTRFPNEFVSRRLIPE